MSNKDELFTDAPVGRCRSVVSVGTTLRRCRWGDGHKADGDSIFDYHTSDPVSAKGLGKFGVAWTDEQIRNVKPESVVKDSKKKKLGFENDEVVLAYPITDPRPSGEA